MAGNTRGKLKEHFEGIHRNFDWIEFHCATCLTLIGDRNPKLTEAVTSLSQGIKILDEIVQSLYSKL